MTEINIEELKVAQLKEELAKRNLDTSGVKKVLQDRLRQSMSTEKPEPIIKLEFESEEQKDDLQSTEIKEQDEKVDQAKDSSHDKNESETNKASHHEDEIQEICPKEADKPNDDSEEVTSKASKNDEEVTKVSEKPVGEPGAVDNENEDYEADQKSEHSCKNHEDAVDCEEKNEKCEKEEEIDKDMVDCVMTNYDEDLDYDLDEPIAKDEDEEEEEEIKDKEENDGEKKEEEKHEEPSNLWVSNLTNKTKAADLKTLLSKHGKVNSVSIVAKGTNENREYHGFVVMASNEDAKKCIEALNESEWEGAKLKVEITTKESIKKPNEKTNISPIRTSLDEEGEKLLAKIAKRKSDMVKKIGSGSKSTSGDRKIGSIGSSSGRRRRPPLKRIGKRPSPSPRATKKSKDFFEDRIKKPASRSDRELRPVIERLRARRRSIEDRKRSISPRRIRTEPRPLRANHATKRYTPPRRISPTVSRRRSRSPISQGVSYRSRSPYRREKSPRGLPYQKERSPIYEDIRRKIPPTPLMDFDRRRDDRYSPDDRRRRNDLYECDYKRREELPHPGMKREYERYKSPVRSIVPNHIAYDFPQRASIDERSHIFNSSNPGPSMDRMPKYYPDEPASRLMDRSPISHHPMASLTKPYEDPRRHSGITKDILPRRTNAAYSPPIDNRRREEPVRREMIDRRQISNNFTDLVDRRPLNNNNSLRYQQDIPSRHAVNTTSDSLKSNSGAKNSNGRWPEVVDYMHRSSNSASLYSSSSSHQQSSHNNHTSHHHNNNNNNSSSSSSKNTNNNNSHHHNSGWSSSGHHHHHSSSGTNHNNNNNSNSSSSSTSQLLASAKAALQNAGLLSSNMFSSLSSRHHQTRNY